MENLEFGKPPEELKVPERVMPNRKEYRRLLKTGKDEQGNEAHTQDVKDLRRATIGDLKAFGVEVNKANKNLKLYIDQLTDQSQWTLLNFIAFLIDSKVLKETAAEDFEVYVRTMKEEVEKARKYMEEHPVSNLPPKDATVVTVDEIKAKKEETEKEDGPKN